MLPSVAAAVFAATRGAAILRVHDVAETVQALAIWRAAANGAAPEEVPGDEPGDEPGEAPEDATG
jgi:dihydropteroate synthase